MFKRIKSRMLFRAFLIIVPLVSITYHFGVENHNILSMLALIFTPTILLVTNFITKPINRIQKIIDSNLSELSLNQEDMSNLSELEKLEKSFVFLVDLNRKHVNDILENERRISTMLDSIDIGIVEIDGDTRMIININQYCSDLIGLDKEDVIGKMYCYELICCHNKTKQCSLSSSDDYSKIHSECTAINRKTGQMIQVMKNAVKIPVSNRSNIVESFVNITERKKREEELNKARKRADEADAGKTSLLKKVCHDIGNRMSESVGLASIMKKIPGLPDICHIRLNQIIDSLKVMDNSLQLMRDGTMLITGHSKIHLDSIDLKEFIRSHVNSFISGIEEKGLQFILDLPEDCHLRHNCFILTDAAKLDAIICNLIGNAKKFTKSGSITWKMEILNETKHVIKIRFSIIDTGIGIADEDQEKIFQIYEQANEDIQKEYGGTGQGLAIVRSYVQMLGGDIELTSIVGKGTCFTFDLEFEFPVYVPKLKMDITPTELSSIRVLAADDNPIIRDILTDVLNDIGVDYIIVDSGESVLNLLENEFFNFIFLDIQMDGISGVETAKRIRENYNTPIIAMTANFADDDIEEYKDSGINDCIGKPFDAEKIKSIIIKFKDSQVLDVEKIRYMYTIDLYLSLVKKFIKEFEKSYEDLVHIENSDIITDELITKFVRVCHTLKGSSSIMYADNIRHLCYMLEKKGHKKEFHREEDKKHIRFLIDKLGEECLHFLKHLNENFKLEDN